MVALGHFCQSAFCVLEHLGSRPLQALVAMVALDLLVLGWFWLEARLRPLAIPYLPKKLGFPVWTVPEGPFL